MMKQYFAEMNVEEYDSLSEALEDLVHEAEHQYETPYVEVAQVIAHDGKRYTVILNLGVSS